MKNKTKIVSERSIFSAALSAVIKAMVITAVALLILTLFMFYGNVSDEISEACATVAAFMSVFYAGFMSAGKRRCAGFLSGLIAGALYVLLMIIIGFVITGTFSISAESVKMFSLSAFGGVLGGIFGVNMKKRK